MPPPPPDVNKGPDILVATLIVTTCAIVTTILRAYVRIVKISNVGMDDYVMFLAATVALIEQAIIVPEVYYGAGRHIQYLKPEDISRGLKLNFLTQPLSFWSTTLVKVSVGFMLLRIAGKKSYARWVIITLMTFMALYTIAGTFTIVFQCNNPRMLWDPTLKPVCMPPPTLRGLAYFNAAVAIFTDVLFAIIIPVTLLWNVQMHRRTKIGVLATLGFGIFACAACSVRITFISSYGKAGDFLWDSTYLTIWNVVECCVGITAANMPCLKPLFRSAFGSTHGGSSDQSQSGMKSITVSSTIHKQISTQVTSRGRESFGSDSKV